MKTEDFNYELNPDLIAQTPLTNRENSKLMILERTTGALEHKKFSDIIDYFNKGDCLVLNNTKVLPARIKGVKTDTNAQIELLLLKEVEKDVWECLSRPFKRLHIGTEINFNDKLKAQVIKKESEGIVLVKFSYEGVFLEILDSIGSMPLPPYIHKKLEDNNRYQTVYAKIMGSAAAPTAGLHFTKELLEKLEKKGVIILYITLHVGLGTFRPVEEADIKNHKMHSEFYMMSEDVSKKLNQAKKENRKIYAVGTTSTRTLETIMQKYHEFRECSGNTDIFIYPGYKFLAIDGLITNFHLPKSTLLMLVSALATKDMIISSYMEAQKLNYRFFSFGDAMFIK